MIYLDNAATTQLCDASKKVILENLDNYYNTASAYQPARELNYKVEQAREKIAELIGAASANEIYFTSGGCEANSWAEKQMLGFTTTIEHSSNKFIPAIEVNSNGIINSNALYMTLKQRPDLLSIMYVNNELGVIQPIDDIAKIAHVNDTILHTDAVQAIPHIKINVQELGIDMMSASAHKFNGPHGVGFLYAREELPMYPLIFGGGQESGRRGGTTNAVGILAMATALEYRINKMDETNHRIAYLSKKLREGLLNIDGTHLNVDPTKTPCVEGILNLRIDGVKGVDMVAMADQYGICISAGSACHEGNNKPSHVLKAIGLSDEDALNSIRISIGRHNTEKEIDTVNTLFPKIIERLRAVKKT